jgi:hypothetical protein
MCALCFSSCTKEKITKSALHINAISYTVDTRSSNTEKEIKNDTLLWCAGDNIEWYNVTTGELKLKKDPIAGSTFLNNCYLIVFLDDNMLFSLNVANPVSSISTHFPCINWEPGERTCKGCKCGNKQDHISGPTCESIYVDEGAHYYISKGYPGWNPGDRGIETSHWDWESIDAEREKNWKTIEPGWSLFIQQLKKEGRYKR